MTRADLARDLYTVSHLTGTFTLRSGVVSNQYFDKYRFESDPASLPLGTERRPLTSLWDGLECYAVDVSDLEPAPLAAAAAETLGRAPDASGLVDHERIGSAWEHARGGVSIVALLFEELTEPASSTNEEPASEEPGGDSA